MEECTKKHENKVVQEPFGLERLDEEISRDPESLRETGDPSKQPGLC